MTAEQPGAGVQALVHEMAITEAEVEARRRFVGLGAEDEDRLRQLGDVLAGAGERIVGALYDHLLAFDETSAFFSTPDEVEHAKLAQLRYLERLTRGPYDREYAEQRLRIGAVHEQIGLEVKYYLGAYSVYLGEIGQRVVAACPGDAERAMGLQLSVLKVMLLDMGLAVDTYVFRRERELRAAIRELETFNHSVAHDLRAPLRAIIGFSEALMEDAADSMDAEARSHLQFIAQGGRRMSQLIEALLELARLNRIEMAVQPLNVSQAATTAAELFVEAARRPVDLRIQPGIWASGDPRLVSVLLDNLIGNAFKFTSRHETALIEVGLDRPGGVPVVYVRDDGAGFDMANVERLFGAFQRLHAESDFEGTGVGLATAMRIVRRHGGRIWAEGATEKGATLRFTLPDLRTEE